MRKILFIIFFAGLIISFFFKDNYRLIKNIEPALLGQPKQTQTDSKPITFTKDDYNYELKPMANYEINALVVHKMDYRLFSTNKTDSVFPVDLCLLWGANLKNNLYQDKTLKFSQDMRICSATWKNNINFVNNDASNNHLIASDENVLKEIDKIETGDQVKIVGKLVNVDAKKIAAASDEAQGIKWQTSTTRTDSGAGACEVIYVQSVEILALGNPLWRLAFTISLYGLIITLVWSIAVTLRIGKNNKAREIFTHH